MDNFSVSALITFYNEENEVFNTLNYALKQTYPFKEIIIINDGSTDQTLKKIKKFCKTFSNIKFINNDKNIGINNSLNKALKFVRTKFFFVISAGDKYDLNINQWCKQAIMKNKNVAMVCGNVEILNIKTNKTIYLKLPFKNEIMLNGKDIVKMSKKQKVTFFGGGVMMNTKLAILSGGYQTDLKWSADWFLYLVLGHRYEFICINKTFSIIQLCSNQYSNSINIWKYQKYIIIKTIKKLKKHYSDIFPLFKKGAILPSYDLRTIYLLFSCNYIRSYFSYLLVWRLLSYKSARKISKLIPRKYHNNLRIFLRN